MTSEVNVNWRVDMSTN